MRRPHASLPLTPPSPSPPSAKPSASDLAGGAADGGKKLVAPVLIAVIVGSFLLVVLGCLLYHRFYARRPQWADEGLQEDLEFANLAPLSPDKALEKARADAEEEEKRLQDRERLEKGKQAGKDGKEGKRSFARSVKRSVKKAFRKVKKAFKPTKRKSEAKPELDRAVADGEAG